MSFNISFIVQAIDQFSPVARTISSSLDKIKKHADTAARSISNMGKGLQNAGKTAVGYLTAPIAGVGVMALKSAAQIETMSVSFETLLKSKDKADVLMKDLIKFAELTPFEMEDIGSSVRQLLGANVPLKDIIKTMSMIGDVASGANVPLTDMTHIFAKSLNKGKAQAEELNQMAERGIPIMQMLAEMAGKSTADVYKAAETGQISSDVIVAAFKKLTKEGGLFYQMAIKQSKTLGGIFSTLKDVVYFTMGDIGMAIVNAFNIKDVMSNAIRWLERMQIKMKEFIHMNPILTKWILIIVAATAVIGPFLFVLGLAFKSIGLMLFGVKALTAAIAFLTVTPLGLFITALGVLVVLAIQAYQKYEPFRECVNALGVAAWELVKAFWNFAKALLRVLNPLNILKPIFIWLYDHFDRFRELVDYLSEKFGTWPKLLTAIGNGIKSVFGGLTHDLNKSAAFLDSIETATNQRAFNPNSSIINSVIDKPKWLTSPNAAATVTVNIVDKENKVKSVESNNKGFLDLAVGKNMRNV
jgi:tape measure domain-containing protein